MDGAAQGQGRSARPHAPPVPVAARQEILFVKRSQDLRTGALSQFITNHRNAQRAAAAWFRDVMTTHQPHRCLGSSFALCAIPRSEVGMSCSACRIRTCFLCGLRNTVIPFAM